MCIRDRSKGIKGIELASDDKVISLSVLNSVDINPKIAKKILKNGSSDKAKKSEIMARQKYILSVTENGFGKQTKTEEFSIQRRGGKGVIAIQTSERNGKVIGANQVNENDELMFISSSGNLIRTKINSISVIGRNTQGVKLIRLSNDDKLLGMERIINDDDDEEQ